MPGVERRFSQSWQFCEMAGLGPVLREWGIELYQTNPGSCPSQGAACRSAQALVARGGSLAGDLELTPRK